MLNGLVEDLCVMAAKGYPDLAFISPRGELHLHRSLSSVKKLRLQLPGTEYLHLHSIEIEAAGITDLSRQTRRRTSSSWRDFAEVLEQGILFDPKGAHQKGFHTDKDHQAWLEIEFETPVVINRLTLRNVDANTCTRARGIKVLVTSGDDADWTTVYDGVVREGKLRDAVKSMLLFGPKGGNTTRTELGRIVSDIAVGDHSNVDKRLKQLAVLTPDERKVIRSQVSSSLLAERSLEWTSHGIRRSFRFWSQAQRRRYVGYTVQIAMDLRGLTENVAFGFGSVLAAVREGELIAHDDDLDLIIGFEPEEATTLAEGIQLVRDFLGARGYRVWGNHLAHQFVSKDGGTKVDVFVGLFEGDDIAWYPGARGSLKRDDIFPTSVAPLLGHYCPLPRNPLIYLEKVYGSTWRVPDPGFVHRWGRKPYADIAGKLQV